MRTRYLHRMRAVAAVISVVILIAVLLSGCGAKMPTLETVAVVDSSASWSTGT